MSFPRTMVQVLPGTPAWRLGARFGEVVAAKGVAMVLVRFRRLGTLWLALDTDVLEA